MYNVKECNAGWFWSDMEAVYHLEKLEQKGEGGRLLGLHRNKP